MKRIIRFISHLAAEISPYPLFSVKFTPKTTTLQSGTEANCHIFFEATKALISARRQRGCLLLDVIYVMSILVVDFVHFLY